MHDFCFVLVVFLNSFHLVTWVHTWQQEALQKDIAGAHVAELFASSLAATW